MKYCKNCTYYYNGIVPRCTLTIDKRTYSKFSGVPINGELKQINLSLNNTGECPYYKDNFITKIKRYFGIIK